MSLNESNDESISILQSDLLLNLVAVFLIMIGSQSASSVSVDTRRSGQKTDGEADISLYLAGSGVAVGSPNSATLDEGGFGRWLSHYAATNSKATPVAHVFHSAEEPAGSVFEVLSQLQDKLPGSKAQLSIIKNEQRLSNHDN